MGGGSGSGIGQPGDQNVGVKPMKIAGRMVNERDRLEGMTTEERAWRKKWLKDQVLTANEPRYIKQFETEYYNPIRRAYRFPLNFIFYRGLQPFIGYEAASTFRFYVGRASLIIAGAYATWYMFKFNHNTWVSRGNWRIIESKNAIYPGEPGYGDPICDKKANDYYDRGFKCSVLNKYKDKD